MNELQKITDAWANWFAKNNGISLHFTASTKYAGNWHLNDYHDNEVEVKTLSDSLRFGSNRLLGTTIAFDEGKTVKNDTSVEQTVETSFTYEKSHTFKWNLVETVKVGVSVKGGFTVPFLATGDASTSLDITISSTQETTKGTKETVVQKIPVKMAPHKKYNVHAKALITEYEADWQMSALLKGHVAVRFNEYFKWNTPEAQALWFIPIETIFNDVTWHEIIDASGYHVTNGGVLTTARGTCTSLVTSNLVVDFKEGGINDDLSDMTVANFESIMDSDYIDQMDSYSFAGIPSSDSPPMEKRNLDVETN